MIKHEQQHKITKLQIAKLETALDLLVGRYNGKTAHKYLNLGSRVSEGDLKQAILIHPPDPICLGSVLFCQGPEKKGHTDHRLVPWERLFASDVFFSLVHATAQHYANIHHPCEIAGCIISSTVLPIAVIVKTNLPHS